MKRFEYRIEAGGDEVSMRDADLLSGLGKEGWDLIHVEVMKTYLDGLGGKRAIYWLKRETEQKTSNRK